MRFSVHTKEAGFLRERGLVERNGPLIVRHVPGTWYRFSPVAAKRHGSAPERNRIKRIIREIMRVGRGSFPAGSYLIFWNTTCGKTTRADIEPRLRETMNLLRTRS
jgi:ribonuclease P protein component